MNKLINLLWAIVFIVGFSLALNAAGIDLSDDYDGKQLTVQLECQHGQLVLKPTGELLQTALVCEN
ncbi:hypothetical protein [Frederiksenia canicola]|uniref:Uncharacterized protein n=1 Tax=Frederiksenia canicola TaxID=123824 RepID=A0AAE7C2B1_9PAST|nr:hypothetical protein [Frederiksenia canicola]QIM65235.1 hypothetical protein A4G17_07195 [Frederiksenia canicola]RPE96337.1 hypothetical protein EDC49_0727 [Frederiksenia canicola]